jgi:hypothetical protein
MAARDRPKRLDGDKQAEPEAEGDDDDVSPGWCPSAAPNAFVDRIDIRPITKNVNVPRSSARSFFTAKATSPS